MGYNAYLTPNSATLQTSGKQYFKIKYVLNNNVTVVKDDYWEIVANPTTINQLKSSASSVNDLIADWVTRLNNYLSSAISTGVFAYDVELSPGVRTIKLECSDSPKYWIEFYWNPTGLPIDDYGGLRQEWRDNFTLSADAINFGMVLSTPKSAPSNQMNNITYGLYDFKDNGLVHLQLVSVDDIFTTSFSIKYSEASDKIYYPLWSKLMNYGFDNLIFEDNWGYLKRSEIFDRYSSENDYYIIYGYFDSRTDIYSVDGINVIGYSLFRMPNVYKWAIDNISVSDSGTEANVLLEYLDSGLISVETDIIFSFSLDGINWQPNSNFTGLQPNTTYTAYVKDQFNGITTEEFYTEAAQTYKLVDPYFKIENANSIKHYEVNASSPFFDNSLYKNQLYYNVEMQCYKQRLTKSDLITTQIKTSYETVIAKVVDENNTIVLNPTVERKVQNTLLQDKRDCMVCKSTDGANCYVYFAGGNIYDANNVVTGTYFDGIYLPSFCYVGMTINLTGTISGGFEVQEILYDNTLKRYVMVILKTVADAGPWAGVCASTYNVENWDIWEYDFNPSSLPVGEYTIIVNATDSSTNYQNVEWRTEPIYIKDAWKKHIVVTYTNDENINQIDYSTGIVHKLLVPARFIKWMPKGDTERFTSDDGSTYTLKSVRKRVVALETSFIPQYLAEKLVIAGQHGIVTVNGYECRLMDDEEVVDNIDGNNPFYKVTMQMQFNESIDVSESMGVISEAANVLGSTSTDVLGV